MNQASPGRQQPADLETIARRERGYELAGETQRHNEAARRQLGAALKHLKPAGQGAPSWALLAQAEDALTVAGAALDAALKALDSECSATEFIQALRETLNHAA